MNSTNDVKRWTDYVGRFVLSVLTAGLIALFGWVGLTGNRLSVAETKIEQQTSVNTELKQQLSKLGDTLQSIDKRLEVISDRMAREGR